MQDIYILGIESSCDETSAAVVRNGREVMSNVIASQIDIHEEYGGVVPEIASRKHVESISRIVDTAMEDAGLGFSQLSAFAVTNGPGLVGALLVGVSYAKALAFATKKPFIGVHHIEGHICAGFIDNPSLLPPFITLVASGGHTHLVLVKDYGEYEILGRTRDDAAGEAYDKVARALGLGYPGGPKIDRLAGLGNPGAISFPRVVIDQDTYDFSFSGLKSAVLNYLNKAAMSGCEINNADVAASFQAAVVDVLVAKTLSACAQKNISTVSLAGGVACNSALRSSFLDACIKENIKLHLPKAVYCTDNGAMIAACGYYSFIKGRTDGLDLNAYPSLRLGIA